MEKQVFPCMLGHFPSTGRMRKKCGNVEMQIAMEKVEICVENNVESRLKVVKNVQNRHYALLLSQIFLMVSSTSCFSV